MSFQSGNCIQQAWRFQEDGAIYFQITGNRKEDLWGKSPFLVTGLSALVNAYFGLNEYNKAITYGNKALSLMGWGERK